MTRRKTPRRLTLDTVITQAAELCDASGIDSLSMSALADKLGVRPPALYNHVANLENLHAQLSIKGLTELTLALEAAVSGDAGKNPSRAIAVASRKFAKEHPTLFAYATYRLRLPKAARKRHGAKLLEIAHNAYAEEAGSTANSEIAQYFIRCFIYGFVALEANGALEPAKNINKLFDALIEVADAGIRSLAAK